MIDNQLAVIVLAAGQGTRMKSAIPKVLHPLAGRSLVGHVLRTARALGPATIRVVVRHERDLVIAEVLDDTGVLDGDGDVGVVDQDDIPGTGRAVELGLEALPGFVGDVLVLSADVPLLEPAELAGLISSHRSSGAAATVLSARLGDPTGYGRIIRRGDGSVDRIVEQRDASRDEASRDEVNAGVYVFQSGPLRERIAHLGTDNAQGERYLTEVVALLRDAGLHVAASLAADARTALGVNDRVQLSEAGDILNARIVRRWQLAGVTVIDPRTTWIDDTVTLAADVTILPQTQVLGATTVAAGATIGPDTTLIDCEVGEGARVNRTDATLAVIGADASVGPFAYLRPGTYLGADGKIGTFVETKNVRIGDGSKVPHLSYIGDAEIGVGANIGAGTIVANYDGVNKHRTSVGDHVRTGSHNVFVAPVRIGDGAYTGAGTVVRKDVPPGSLALLAAPQRNVEGWVARSRPGTAAAEAAERAKVRDEEQDD